MASRWARIRRPSLTLAVVNEATGSGWQAWLNSVGGDEKAQLIRAAARDEVGAKLPNRGGRQLIRLAIAALHHYRPAERQRNAGAAVAQGDH